MLDPQLDAAHLMFAQVQSALGHPGLVRTALARIPSTSPYASSARVMDAWTLVDEVRSDGLLSQVRLRIGDQFLTAVITRDAVNELKLKRGDEAVAIIKSTEVMIGRTSTDRPARRGR